MNFKSGPNLHSISPPSTPQSKLLALRTSSPHPSEPESGEGESDSGAEQPHITQIAVNVHRKESLFGELLNRRHTQRVKGKRREKVRMVGHHLHSAFRSWFKDTEDDGSPLLPGALSKKYNVLPHVLGQGSFAVVKSCVEKSTGTERALKIIAKKPLKENSEKMLQEEIHILGKVEHPHVIKMWDLYETKEGVFIVTDLCRGGELFDRLVEKVFYNELDARHIVRQIFEGVAYLHKQDIIHRDLKPENILLREKKEPSDIVISDFGLSKFIPDEGLLMTACGSPQYVAPEVLLGKGYGPPVDIWSAGVIAYCLLAGYTPFYGEDQPTLFQQIIGMKVEFEPKYWGEVSDSAKEFILKCLCPAEKRFTPEQALKHPWLADLPDLHEDTPDEHRGCCLKESAKRHLTAKEKFGRAVTAVETVSYLQKLHHLRQQHSKDIPEEKLHSLIKVATNISLHKRGDSLLHSPTHEGAAADRDVSTSTLTPSSSVVPTPEGSLIQMADPEVIASKSTTAKGAGRDAPFCIAGGTAPTSRRSGTAAVAAAAEATAHGENPAGNSEGHPISDDGAKSGQSSPARSTSGLSDQTMTPGRRAASKKPEKKDATLDTLLDQYKSAQLPSSARVDPTAEMQEKPEMTISKVWQYIPFFINQGISITSAIASHAVYGPPKKSWGIEMSVFTRIMRDSAQYTQFATIAGMQSFFELSSFLPVPKDGLITPVSFRVKKRNLRGLLAEVDAQEDGKRELTGEWVVGKQTWRRLQSDWRSGKSREKERVILYIHGGAYFIMSAVTHRPLTIALSKYTECRIFGINYRLAPDCKFPGPLHDVVSSWFRLTEDLGIPPSNIVIGADSAGGGLAFALMYYLRDNGYDLPSGAILFSPWVDLTMSCDSWETNSAFDYLPMPVSGNHMNPVAAYLGDNIEKYITHPYASPLFGDMRGLPPLLIQCGDAEVLRDEGTLLAHKASKSGVAVRHELYEDCVHVFQAFLFLDASRKALQSARHFVRTALDKRDKRKSIQRDTSRQTVDSEMRAGMVNERGESVEPRTGEKAGSYKVERGTESDSETAGQQGQRERSGRTKEEEAEWAEFDEAARRAASAAQPANVAKKALGAEAEAKRAQSDAGGPANGSRSADMQRSQSDRTGHSAKSSTSNDSGHSHSRSTGHGQATFAQSSHTTSNAPRHSDKHRRNLSNSLQSMSLTAARDRAEAGMRYQQSAGAPALGNFHDPLPSAAHPRMRRTASNVAIDDIVQSFENDPSSLRTRVFTPGDR
ncbi:Pkinase-domain-containing protein [Ceraceosorus guamensis]|uniref:Pkinase-domain-containing protein n=1 Tax=Ceraceosorus guamensis TaxID=1522189 RepID=A0A316W2T7_9BASI|nr:Pkinase-domain-containing protein [Ceraceosorus guamensis]PWN44207.1 Pkinase-domain-containing protein [Ceraceosorus guamensis]